MSERWPTVKAGPALSIVLEHDTPGPAALCYSHEPVGPAGTAESRALARGLPGSGCGVFPWKAARESRGPQQGSGAGPARRATGERCGLRAAAGRAAAAARATPAEQMPAARRPLSGACALQAPGPTGFPPHQTRQEGSRCAPSVRNGLRCGNVARARAREFHRQPRSRLEAIRVARDGQRHSTPRSRAAGERERMPRQSLSVLSCHSRGKIATDSGQEPGENCQKHSKPAA